MSMISLSTINKKIKETQQQIESFMEFESSEMARFQVAELNRRLTHLLEEKQQMEDAQARELVLLRAYGENVDTGRISNRVLIGLLNGFQTMMDDISNVLVGANGSRGQLNDYAKEIADFEVCGVFAGSFGVRLEKNYHQVEITNQSLKTNDVLQEFFNILENSSDGEKLIERISPYGQRTVKQYRQWLKQMKDDSINIELNWTNEISEKRRMDIKYSDISDVIYTLDSISEIRNEDIVLSGVLTGINIRTNTFELRTEDNKIIKGKSLLETLIDGSDKIGSDIKATLVKSVSQSSVCGEKETWFLSGISIKEKNTDETQKTKKNDYT